MPTRTAKAASARGPEEALVTVARRTYDLMLSDIKTKARISVREIGNLGVGYHFSATFDAYVRKAKKETRVSSRVFSVPLVKTLLSESGNVVELRNADAYEQYFVRHEWNEEIPPSVFSELPANATPVKSTPAKRTTAAAAKKEEPPALEEPTTPEKQEASQDPELHVAPEPDPVPTPAPMPEIALPEVPAGAPAGDPLPALVSYIGALRTENARIAAELTAAHSKNVSSKKDEEKIVSLEAQVASLTSDVEILRAEKAGLEEGFGTLEADLREKLAAAEAEASRAGDLVVKIELISEAVRDAVAGRRGALGALGAIEEVIDS